MSWNDERVETLRSLWNEGLSASQISRVLGNGISRNAVIGKVHRLGLAGRSAAPRKTYAERVTRKIFVAHEPEPPPPEPAEPITLESGARVTIANVCDGQCRWPHGDPQDRAFHLCGNATLHGSVYCLAHSRKAYSAGNPRPKPDDATEELAVIARAERTFA